MSSRYSRAEFTHDETPNKAPHHDPYDATVTTPVFEIDVLLKKLEGYKAQLDETEARLRPQGNLSPKEIADVAAAARFREEIERRAGLEQSSPSPVKRRIGLGVDMGSGAPFSTYEQPSLEITADASSRFPARSTSLGQTRPQNKRPVPLRSQSAVTRSTGLPGFVSHGSVKSHRGSVTVSQSRHSITDNIVTTHIQLEPSGEQPNPPYEPSQPARSDQPSSRDALLILPPNEDQVRREMEGLAIRNTHQMLDQTLRDPSFKAPTVHIIELNGHKSPTSPLDLSSTGPSTPVSEVSSMSMYNNDFGGVWTRKDRKAKLNLRSTLSIFKRMQKGPSTDDLIEMYMDEHQIQDLKRTSPKRKRSMILGKFV